MNGYILKYCKLECPRATPKFQDLVKTLEQALNELNLSISLLEKFPVLHFHHLIKISISGCPNGCSQPQIKDIGVMGYLKPHATIKECTQCALCSLSCMEQAIQVSNSIYIDNNACLFCGDCFRACPTDSIQLKETGWNLYLGGKLGRHPRLGHFYRNTTNNDELIQWIVTLLNDYAINAPINTTFSNFLDNFI